MTKNISIATLALTCIIVIIYGNFHWKNTTTATVSSLSQNEIVELKETSTNSHENENEDHTQPILTTAQDLETILSNWPTTAKEHFLTKVSQNDPYTFVVTGSTALEVSQNGWPHQFKEALESTLGPNTIEVIIAEASSHSLDYVYNNEYEEIIQAEPDLILFEPLTLKDNGLVRIEDSHKNLDTVIQRVKEAVPEAQFIIQPPHPIYNARYYPLQVEALKEHAQLKGYTYLDHWSAWPAQDDEQLTQYLNEDSSAPSRNGHALWADYLSAYFLNE